MNTRSKLLLFLPLIFLGFTIPCSSQPFENAVQYMDFITKANNELTTKYLFYMSAVSHGKSARKVEKRRMEVVAAIGDTRYSIQGLPPYKGDKTLKDTTVAYLKLLNSVFNEDYSRIVNMEEIAEQSYDAMEAYLLAQEKAYEKLNQASSKQNEMQRKFAAKNNITLIDSESDLEIKSKMASDVMGHCNEVYLLFFKCHKQESYLMEALNKKNIVAIEQNINSLQKFAEQGMEKLKELKGYKNDGSLIEACRRSLIFYKAEAAKSSALTDFFLKEEAFTKIKKQFQASKQTKQDVDQYNKAVGDINDASKGFNSTNDELNKQRKSALDDWNKTYSKYMDEHMPRQQRQ